MPATCTVRTAVHGCCGKPAVVTFTTAYGETFAECEEHATGPMGHGAKAPAGPEFIVGETVGVEHVGIFKTGTVVRVGRTRVHVRVPIGRGRAATTKIIVRGFGEVR